MTARTRGSATAERPARRSVSVECCPICLPITQTDRVSAREALSAAATFYSATCKVLYAHRCSELSYRTTSMRCSVSHTRNAEVSRKCYEWTSTTTNITDDTTIPPPAHRRERKSPWRLDTSFHRVKHLSRRLLDRSKNAILTHPTCIWRPRCE